MSVCELRRYNTLLRSHPVQFLCPHCYLPMPSSDYEKHYAQQHSLNPCLECVWCDGRFRWVRDRKSMQVESHLIPCWLRFLTQKTPQMNAYDLQTSLYNKSPEVRIDFILKSLFRNFIQLVHTDLKLSAVPDLFTKNEEELGAHFLQKLQRLYRKNLFPHEEETTIACQEDVLTALLYRLKKFLEFLCIENRPTDSTEFLKCVLFAGQLVTRGHQQLGGSMENLVELVEFVLESFGRIYLRGFVVPGRNVQIINLEK